MKNLNFKEKSSKIYFFALVPGAPVQQEIMQYKQDAKIMFNSSRSLNSPAHITIIPPFSMELADEDKLSADLSSGLGKVKEFYIELNGFGHFGHKVIFVNVADNQFIKDLNKKLRRVLESYIGLEQNFSDRFNPHITVAFKDLRPEIFPIAWKYYSEIVYHRVIKIDSIELLRHENNLWKIVRSFKS